MAIEREKLLPILERLTEGRDDIADIMDEVNALDVPAPDVDGVNAEWQKKYDDLNTVWTDRYRRAVFHGDIDTVAEAASTAEVVEQQEDMTTPETYDDLFSEQEVIKNGN